LKEGRSVLRKEEDDLARKTTRKAGWEGGRPVGGAALFHQKKEKTIDLARKKGRRNLDASDVI